jgi:hypothetical protein
LGEVTSPGAGKPRLTRWPADVRPLGNTPRDEYAWHPTASAPVATAAQLITDSGINRLRFSACEDLLDAGAGLVDGAGRATPDGGNMPAVQATRATHSFESVIALCRVGRGVQAAMINRSLLEDVLEVH